ncbi:MAG: isoprenylcysteine carboxylmethyltransferase family protein [Promethearchaeota archaeon]|nr:MAG: isoprenylcysteine carboxylmethyltransferase family protein [Candidatus Lokiarchaeota archaeon]
MENKRHAGADRELPHAHLYHAFLPVIFWLIWFLDLQFFRISTVLNDYVPLIIRVILFGTIFAIALIFIFKSHNLLFKSHEPPDHVITAGILRVVRNPMYFGILLIYISLICLSISLISIGVFIIVFLVYNWMVNYEERILVEKYGEEYRKYQKSVPKWIPNPFNK